MLQMFVVANPVGLVLSRKLKGIGTGWMGRTALTGIRIMDSRTIMKEEMRSWLLSIWSNPVNLKSLGSGRMSGMVIEMRRQFVSSTKRG